MICVVCTRSGLSGVSFWAQRIFLEIKNVRMLIWKQQQDTREVIMKGEARRTFFVQCAPIFASR